MYLVIVYKADKSEEYYRLDEKELFRFIDLERGNNTKFCIYKLDNCLLDWS